MQCTTQTFGQTDIGRRRKRNEDQFLIADLNESIQVHDSTMAPNQFDSLSAKRGKLLMVADGMGGSASGELASSIVVNSLVGSVLDSNNWLLDPETWEGNDASPKIRKALLTCQQHMAAEIAAHPECHGMGSTLTLACVLWPKLYVIHLGDSRCYLVREQSIQLLTRDQTVAQMLLDRGELPAEKLQQSRLKHVLWGYVGGNASTLAPEFRQVDLQYGDALILCTNGLSRFVHEAEILTTVRSETSPERICRRLVDAANAAGGSDNITVVSCNFSAPAESEMQEPKGQDKGQPVAAPIWWPALGQSGAVTAGD